MRARADIGARGRPSAPRSDVDRAAVDGERGFLEGLGQGGVGVAGARDVLAAGAELDRDGRLGDQVAGARAEDVHAEHAVGLGVGEDLDAAVGLSQGAGAAVGPEREDALPVVDPGGR